LRVGNALIVDEIRDREDGSVDLIGLREDLFFDDVPVILERLTLFLEMELAPEDLGKRHQIDLRVVEGNTGLVRAGGPLRFTLPTDHPRPVAALDPTLFEVAFHEFGPHFVDVLINGEHSRRLYLSVRQRDPEE
jgi:hypothetical protein